MGITKLMHMKESPGTPYIHLKNGIEYILDEKNMRKKTGDGVWVGGNCGSDSGEILRQFLQTKAAFEKTDGRQGYHFVLSFKPGEVNEEKCYNIVKDFCETYLGDRYDYVFAVHNDKAHMHGHIIFNSVSRIDGYKYHYKDGDWRKSVQPVTDDICEKHHVSRLECSKERKGVSYAQWLVERTGTVSKKEILYADVDFALSHSPSWDHFIHEMNLMGYTIKEGYSRVRDCAYVSFQPPIMNGKHRRAWRSYNLRPGYTKSELIQRMKKMTGVPAYEILTEKMSKQIPGELKQIASTHSKTLAAHRRMYQAVNYYRLPNPYAVPAARVRADMTELQKIIGQCLYLEKNKLHSLKAICEKRDAIQAQCRVLRHLKKNLQGVKQLEREWTSEQKQDIEQCRQIIQYLSKDEYQWNDIQWEAADDAYHKLIKRLPESVVNNEERIAAVTAALRKLNREKRLVDQIIAMEAYRYTLPVSPVIDHVIAPNHSR